MIVVKPEEGGRVVGDEDCGVGCGRRRGGVTAEEQAWLMDNGSSDNLALGLPLASPAADSLI